MPNADERRVKESYAVVHLETIDDILALVAMLARVNDELAPFEAQITEKRAAIYAAVRSRSPVNDSLSPPKSSAVSETEIVSKLRLYDEHYLLRHRLSPLMQPLLERKRRIIARIRVLERATSVHTSVVRKHRRIDNHACFYCGVIPAGFGFGPPGWRNQIWTCRDCRANVPPINGG